MTNRPMFTRMLMMFFVFALAVGGGLVGCETGGGHGTDDPLVVDPVVVDEVLGSLTGHYEGHSVRLDGTTSELFLDIFEGPVRITIPAGPGPGQVGGAQELVAQTSDEFIGRLTVISPAPTVTPLVDFADFSGKVSGERRELLEVGVVFDYAGTCDYLGLFLVRSDDENFGGNLNPQVTGTCDHGGTVTVTLTRTSTTPTLPPGTVVVFE